jgi:magnesium-transporting ATPase (P-type)
MINGAIFMEFILIIVVIASIAVLLFFPTFFLSNFIKIFNNDAESKKFKEPKKNLKFVKETAMLWTIFILLYFSVCITTVINLKNSFSYESGIREMGNIVATAKEAKTTAPVKKQKEKINHVK